MTLVKVLQSHWSLSPHRPIGGRFGTHLKRGRLQSLANIGIRVNIPLRLLKMRLHHRLKLLSLDFCALFEIARNVKEDDADRKSTRLNSSHSQQSRMPSSA